MQVPDYYAILGIEPTASEREIRKAYRTKSLTCHPDRNPGDEEAAQLFHLITTAVNTLTDPTRKKIHDDLLRATHLKRERFKKMDQQRRMDREKLEKRENEAKKPKFNAEDEEKLEIQRLREINMQKMLAVTEMKRQSAAASVGYAQVKQAQEQQENASRENCTLKVKWSRDLEVDQIILEKILTSFGPVDDLIMSKTGKRSAIVVYHKFISAYNAMKQGESYGISLSWLNGEPDAAVAIRVAEQANQTIYSSKEGKGKHYEDITLEKLKKAEQQKIKKVEQQSI